MAFLKQEESSISGSENKMKWDDDIYSAADVLNQSYKATVEANIIAEFNENKSFS